MIHRLSANTAIDHSGYAGIENRAMIAANDPTAIPNHRPKVPPANSEADAHSSRMPMISVTQPQLLRSANT